jgi:hypothetical protein
MRYLTILFAAILVLLGSVGAASAFSLPSEEVRMCVSIGYDPANPGGINSYLDLDFPTIAGGYDVESGVYYDAWCVDDEVTIGWDTCYDGVRLYSSMDPANPVYGEWVKINYMMNNLPAMTIEAGDLVTDTPGVLEVKDIQDALYYFMGDKAWEDLGADAQALVEIGESAPEFYNPECDEYIAIVAYKCGIQPLIFMIEAPGCGCTLTPGYWKTHADPSEARYDTTWSSSELNHPAAAYLSVLLTPPKGDAWYILAHQTIAAELNILKGTYMPSSAGDAYEHALDLLHTYPSGGVTVKNVGASVVNDFTSTASILDAYNNGLMGVPHCD